MDSSLFGQQKKSEELGEEGDIDGSLALHQQAEQLRVNGNSVSITSTVGIRYRRTI